MGENVPSSETSSQKEPGVNTT